MTKSISRCRHNSLEPAAEMAVVATVVLSCGEEEQGWGATNLFLWPDCARNSPDAGWQFWCCASSFLRFPTLEPNAGSVLSSQRITKTLYKRLYRLVAGVPRVDTPLVFQVKPRRDPSQSTQTLPGWISCVPGTPFISGAGDLDIKPAMQQILLAFIYHPVLHPHACVDCT